MHNFPAPFPFPACVQRARYLSCVRRDADDEVKGAPTCTAGGHEKGEINDWDLAKREEVGERNICDREGKKINDACKHTPSYMHTHMATCAEVGEREQ